MFGWMNDCCECLVLTKFGEDTWHKIKEKANCTVPDGGFIRYKYYPDSDTLDLVIAASEVLGISIDDVLIAFGDFFVDYVEDNGYSNVMECLGSNLRDWLSNLNSLHDHLEASFPKGIVAPVFWTEDDTQNEEEGGGGGGSGILLHYYSKRGSLLVPLVVGLLHKVAKLYFDTAITMDQLQLQDEESNVTHTTWRIQAANPEEAYKLQGKKKKKKSRKSIQKTDDDTDDSGDSITCASTLGTGSTRNSMYGRAVREGGTLAKNLRVEELVKRAYHNQTCELYHAFTEQQYWYLVDYWMDNTIHGKGDDEDLWCYEVWELKDDEPTSWPGIHDLPPVLHPETRDESKFGGVPVETGAYPPTAPGNKPQSVYPKIRVVNGVTNRTVDLTLSTPNDDDTKIVSSLKETLVPDNTDNDGLLQDVLAVPKEQQEGLDSGALELSYIIWNEDTKEAYHTFTVLDLEDTKWKQVYEMAPKTFDPIIVVVQCTEVSQVDDDEEDI